jgi:hypothetical protein
MFTKAMNFFNINYNDLAILTLATTTFTVIDINVVIGALTGLTGLGIQLYFKMQQNRREQERHNKDMKDE